MTINDIIETVNTFKINNYDDKDKVKWLSNLDLTIKKELYDLFEEKEADGFTGYGEDTPLDTELLIPEPYGTEVYRHYIEAQINLANKEMNDYNNSMALFNNALSNYRVWYNNTHTHIQPELRW